MLQQTGRLTDIGGIYVSQLTARILKKRVPYIMIIQYSRKYSSGQRGGNYKDLPDRTFNHLRS